LTHVKHARGKTEETLTAERELSPQLSHKTPSKSRANRSPPIAARGGLAALNPLLPAPPPGGGTDRTKYWWTRPSGKVERQPKLPAAGKAPTPRKRTASMACVRPRKKKRQPKGAGAMGFKLCGPAYVTRREGREREREREKRPSPQKRIQLVYVNNFQKKTIC